MKGLGGKRRLRQLTVAIGVGLMAGEFSILPTAEARAGIELPVLARNARPGRAGQSDAGPAASRGFVTEAMVGNRRGACAGGEIRGEQHHAERLGHRCELCTFRGLFPAA